MIESVSGIFVFKCVVGLWVREAKNAILYLYRKALILASELIRPPVPNALSTTEGHTPSRINFDEVEKPSQGGK